MIVSGLCRVDSNSFRRSIIYRFENEECYRQTSGADCLKIKRLALLPKYFYSFRVYDCQLAIRSGKYVNQHMYTINRLVIDTNFLSFNSSSFPHPLIPSSHLCIHRSRCCVHLGPFMLEVENMRQLTGEFRWGKISFVLRTYKTTRQHCGGRCMEVCYKPPGAVGGIYGSGCFHLSNSSSVSKYSAWFEVNGMP